MIDFDKLIAAAIADGTDMEDFAKGLIDAMNRASAAKKESEKTEREKIIDHFHEVFNKNYEKGELCLADAGALILLSVAEDTEEGKTMDDKELIEFYRFLEGYLTSVTEAYKFFRAFDEKKKGIKSAVNDIFNKRLKAAASASDCEIQHGKHEAISSKVNDKLLKNSDTEIINKFLADLFD